MRGIAEGEVVGSILLLVIFFGAMFVFCLMCSHIGDNVDKFKRK